MAPGPKSIEEIPRFARRSVRVLGALLGSALAVLLVAAATSPVSAAGSRVYRSETWRIRSYTLPGTWELSSQGSYPNLLVAYSHGEGGRITIAAEARGPAGTAERLAARTRPILERQGFRELRLRPSPNEEESRTLVEGVLAGVPATNRRLLRQVYLCEGAFCYVLTLVAPPERPALVRDFEDAARGLVLLPPEPRRD
jgi:hypothetical protein